MEWLLFLLCPLMMLFCMKGMFTGRKKGCHYIQSKDSPEELKSFQEQMQRLQEQNIKLMEEINSIKQTDEPKFISKSTRK
ncbi:DUF2933 domain-containing protein [Rossellomorea arthrocnemi]|uniref:DUF2933 domain-containing protein n=1 Tax=Rossellomorea arthrocnemi TaxID=2769542 RepID=UPI0019195DFF|nr:DUF2933 domain-containing protein [Rossellomorea arthrocnemi]